MNIKCLRSEDHCEEIVWRQLDSDTIQMDLYIVYDIDEDGMESYDTVMSHVFHGLKQFPETYEEAAMLLFHWVALEVVDVKDKMWNEKCKCNKCKYRPGIHNDDDLPF